MKPVRILTLLILGALLTGCIGGQMRRPAPVSDVSNQAKAPSTRSSAESQGVQISAYEPAAPVQSMPVHGKAVTALLASAKQKADSGDYSAAVSAVERALRIEPRNAYIWNRLANLRLRQGRYNQAADLADKSTALAGADDQLKRDNWSLIGQAKRKGGDIQGATAAERKARMLY